MQRRCRSSRFVSTDRLLNYQLGITPHLRLRNCGTANLYPAAGEGAWGIVFDIDEGGLLQLDSFENGCRRTILPIFKSPQPLDALVYVAAIELEVPCRNREYEQLIVEAARRGLPASYRAMLEALEIAPDADEKPVDVRLPRPEFKAI